MSMRVPGLFLGLSLGVLLVFQTVAYADPGSGITLSDWRYFVDTQDVDQAINDPEQALQVFQSAPEQTSTTPVTFNVGNVDQHYWFYRHIVNTSSQSKSLYLLAVVPYRPLLKGYLLDGQGEQAQLLDDSYDHPFTDRYQLDDWQSHWLISAPFNLPPGQSRDVLVQYHADGSSYIPLDIVDELTLVRHIHNDTASADVFYSFSIAAILLFLLFGIAMRDRTVKLYSALFAIALLMLSAMDGHAFMLFWPSSPHWNQYSALVLIYVFCAFGFYVADNAVEPSLQQKNLTPLFSRIFKILIVVSLVMAGLVPVLPATWMTNLSNVFVMMMFSAHARAIFSWSKAGSGRQLKRNLVSIIAAVLIAMIVIVVAIMSFDPGLLPSYILVYSSRFIFILALLATMASIISHVSALRQDYTESLLKEVEAAHRESEMNKELLEAEQRYSKVRALASLRQQQLASASHDMKQPLISLRSTLDTLAEQQSPEIRQQLSNAFSYLENLCTRYLSVSRPADEMDEDEAAEADDHVDDSQKQEPYAVNLVLQTVFRMFEADAQGRGIALRMQPSSIDITATPTIVIRIVSNLVSNAIKHSGANKILIGVRRRKDTCAIIVADNGKGISETELEHVMQAYKKGPDSTGEGLGMAICKQLAEQHGIGFDIETKEGEGTCFILSIQQ